MLTRRHISGREAAALVLLILLPLGVLSALAVRAAHNEQAAIRSSMQSELERHASDAGAAYERTVSALREQLRQRDGGRLSPPPYARRVVIDPRASNRPSTLGSEPPAPPAKACGALGRDLAATARDAAKAQQFLSVCQESRSRAGRYLWPLLALHPDALARPTVAAFTRWLQQHTQRQSPAERAAQGLELQRAEWLPAATRIRLTALATGAADDDSSGKTIARDKWRQQPGAAEIRWDDAQSRGQLRRLDDDSYAGFVIDRAALKQAIAAGWPSLPDGIVARLANATPVTASFPGLRGDTRVVLAWEHADELSRRSTRSRQLLVAIAAIAGLALLALAWLFVSRLRAQRQLSALRTDFVAAVSHELRTPIASLRMLSELLAEDQLPADEVPTAQRALVREAERLGETVDQLLSFSRMQAGKLQARRADCDVSALVEQVVGVFEERHGLMVERHIEPQIQAAVDAPGIRMALRNLLENARKHAPDGQPYEVSLKRENLRLVLAVWDHGPGIPKGFERSVFQPFERAGDRLSEATEGSGIGLSLVRHVAHAHGGNASVANRSGQGAMFTLWLPLEDG